MYSSTQMTPEEAHGSRKRAAEYEPDNSKRWCPEEPWNPNEPYPYQYGQYDGSCEQPLQQGWYDAGGNYFDPQVMQTPGHLPPISYMMTPQSGTSSSSMSATSSPYEYSIQPMESTQRDQMMPPHYPTPGHAHDQTSTSTQMHPTTPQEMHQQQPQHGVIHQMEHPMHQNVMPEQPQQGVMHQMKPTFPQNVVTDQHQQPHQQVVHQIEPQNVIPSQNQQPHQGMMHQMEPPMPQNVMPEQHQQQHQQIMHQMEPPMPQNGVAEQQQQPQQGMMHQMEPSILHNVMPEQQHQPRQQMMNQNVMPEQHQQPHQQIMHQMEPPMSQNVVAEQHQQPQSQIMHQMEPPMPQNVTSEQHQNMHHGNFHPHENMGYPNMHNFPPQENMHNFQSHENRQMMPPGNMHNFPPQQCQQGFPPQEMPMHQPQQMPHPSHDVPVFPPQEMPMHPQHDISMHPPVFPPQDCHQGFPPQEMPMYPPHDNMHMYPPQDNMHHMYPPHEMQPYHPMDPCQNQNFNQYYPQMMSQELPPWNPLEETPQDMMMMQPMTSQQTTSQRHELIAERYRRRIKVKCNVPPALRAHVAKQNDEQVLCMVNGRFAIVGNLTKYKLRVEEIRRRIDDPELLNSSTLSCLFRKAKRKNASENMRQDLAKHGIDLKACQRMGCPTTSFTPLLEEEALVMAHDMNKLANEEWNKTGMASYLTDWMFAEGKDLRKCLRDVEGSIRLMERWMLKMSKVIPKIVEQAERLEDIDDHVNSSMKLLSLRTHGFAIVNQFTWLRECKHLLLEMKSMLENAIHRPFEYPLPSPYWAATVRKQPSGENKKVQTSEQ